MFFFIFTVYTLYKADAECSANHGRSEEIKVATDRACFKYAKNHGAKMFITCHNTRFYCFMYKNAPDGKCTTIPNHHKCKIYTINY